MSREAEDGCFGRSFSAPLAIVKVLYCHFLAIPRDRYEGLKEEGKLSKFMEKKRKKNAAKDHRWLPSKRQNRG